MTLQLREFEGRTLHDAYPRDRERLVHVPFYPIYDRDELRRHREDPLFYWYTQGVANRDAQASRAVPLRWDERVLLPATARLPELFDYYRQAYGEPCDRDGLEFFEGTFGYRTRLAELFAAEPDLRYAGFQPFIPTHVDPERFYTDASVTAGVNDKDRLAELTEMVPRMQIFAIEELERATEHFDFPFWIKEGTGTGGDTVMRIDGMDDLRPAKARLQQLHLQRVMVCEHFPHEDNLNVQMHVTPDGEVSMVGYSRQRVEGGVYLGNVVPMEQKPADLPECVRRVAVQATEAAYRKGWFGITGLDILHRKADDECRLVDPNFRLNGSTTFLMLRRVIARLCGGRRELKGVGIYPKDPEATMTDVLRRMERLFEDGRLFLVGGARIEKGTEDAAKGPFKFYGGLVGDSTDEIADQVERPLAEHFEVG